ncbi:PrsW family intramembrane metalloprotease [Mycolicibacterium sp. 3033]|nr:PrsW family intramembrane metalloprotease [Mycolicibacterium aurantiacum]
MLGTLVGLIGGSGVWLAIRLFGHPSVRPESAVASLLVWSAYAAVLSIAVAAMSRSARPSASSVVLAALWGGLAAAALAESFASVTRGAIRDSLGSWEAWTSAVAAPVPEEVCKVAGVLLIMTARPALRSPLSGLILGAIVGVAFNAAEGLAYSIAEIPEAGSLEPLWSDLIVRGLLTGLITHAGLGAIAGAGIGYAFCLREHRRIGMTVALLVSAVALHALIDSPFLDTWGIWGVMAKQVPIAVAAWGVSRSARAMHRRLRRGVSNL